MNKKELRDLYLKKRRVLLPEQVEALSAAIIQQLIGLNFDQIQVLHLFYPISGKREFNSVLFKEQLKSIHPEISLVLPRSDIKSHTLTNILWEDDTPLNVNEWGITEPLSGTEVPALLIDMVIVPLLAFDVKGNRVGYGKGFYDRFLSACRSDVVKVGVSYFEPEPEFEEVDKFDIPLDICVTPKQIWRFNNS